MWWLEIILICTIYRKELQKITKKYGFLQSIEKWLVLAAFKIVKMPKACLLYDNHSLVKEYQKNISCYKKKNIIEQFVIF